jgi:hypothetical protein
MLVHHARSTRKRKSSTPDPHVVHLCCPAGIGPAELFSDWDEIAEILEWHRMWLFRFDEDTLLVMPSLTPCRLWGSA